jgi:hypothetical protein
MTSVIIELQGESLNPNVRVSDLLRKALIVARKLRLSEFQEWIESELGGYKKETPEYRMTKGQVRAFNPYHGWQLVFFSDPEEGERASRRANGQSVAELESLLEGDERKGALHMPFSQQIQQRISKSFDVGFETQVSLFVERTSIVRILDAVRNIVLNWALKLEEEGILGEELAFTENEKRVASHSPQSINNFYGPVQNPQIAQGNQQAIQMVSNFQFDPPCLSEFLKRLEEAIPDLALAEAKLSELESELTTLRAQLKSPNPKKNIIKEGLSSIRNILEGAGGGLASTFILELIKMPIG